MPPMVERLERVLNKAIEKYFFYEDGITPDTESIVNTNPDKASIWIRPRGFRSSKKYKVTIEESDA